MTAIVGEQPSTGQVIPLPTPHAHEGFFDPEIVHYEDIAKIDGAEVRYRVYEPVEPVEDTPIHIRNGFMGTGPAYYGLGKELAKRGRWAVVTESVRSQRGPNALHPHPLRLQAQAGYAAMREVAYWLDTPQVDIIGHSMGGPVSTMIALRHPNLVRAISYAGSAGQDGKHTFMNRVGCIPQVFDKEIKPNIAALREHSGSTTLLAIESFKYVFPHMLRTLGEGVYVACHDDRAAVAQVRKNGTATGAVIMEADTFFDVKTMLEEAEEHDHVMVIPKAFHIDPNANPASHADVQVEMLNTLSNPDRLHAARTRLRIVP